MGISLRESNLHACSLMFNTLNMDLSFMQLNQLYTSINPIPLPVTFQIDYITTPETISE